MTSGQHAPDPAEDHAGSVLCRLLSQAAEVKSVATLGCDQMPDGDTWYGLEVVLADGRHLLVDATSR